MHEYFKSETLIRILKTIHLHKLIFGWSLLNLHKKHFCAYIITYTIKEGNCKFPWQQMMQIWNNKNTSFPTSDTDHWNHTSLTVRCEKALHFWFFNFSVFTMLFVHILIFSIFIGPGTYHTLHNLQANTAIKKILIYIFYNAIPTSKYFISCCLKSHGMYYKHNRQQNSGRSSIVSQHGLTDGDRKTLQKILSPTIIACFPCSFHILTNYFWK